MVSTCPAGLIKSCEHTDCRLIRRLFVCSSCLATPMEVKQGQHSLPSCPPTPRCTRVLLPCLTYQKKKNNKTRYAEAERSEVELQVERSYLHRLNNRFRSRHHSKYKAYLSPTATCPVTPLRPDSHSTDTQMNLRTRTAAGGPGLTHVTGLSSQH